MSTTEIKIGALATLVGPYAAMGEDGLRGLDLAVAEFGGQIAGKKITVIKESTNAMPDDAVMYADILLNRKHVDFIIGPLSGNEGIAIRDFAKTRPDKAFINGIAGAQDITLRDPAPNFFSFSSHGVQWMAGLADYVYNTQGYKRVATLAEDYSYPHGQIAGFTLQYCKLGGKIVQKFWVSLGTSDYSSVIKAMPNDIDAIFVAVGGTDAVNFFQQYAQTGRKTPLIGGSITIDQTVLDTGGGMADWLAGTASSGPLADDNPDPAWQAFVKSYRTRYPRALATPSLFAWGYYVNTRGALLALQQVNGELSEVQTDFMKALAKVAFLSPTGPIKLDHNRQANANVFISVLDRKPDGSLFKRLVKTITNVNSTLGIPEDEFLKIGAFHRDNPPACP